MLRDAIHLAPAYVVPGVASLLLVPTLFTLLGAASYGSWALMVALANGVALLVSSWPESVTVRYGHRAAPETSGLRIVLALIGCGLAGAIGAEILIPSAGAGEIAATSILSIAIGGYLLALAALQAQLRFGRLSRAATTRAVIGSLLTLGLAVATGSAIACVIGIAVGFGAGIVDAWTTGRAAPALAPDQTGHVRGTTGYGASSAVNVTGMYVLGSADKFLLASFRPMADVGVYSATYAIVDLLFRFLPAIVLVPMRQRLFREWDAGDETRVRLEILGLATLILWAMACLQLVVIWAGHLLPGIARSLNLVGPIAAGSVALVVAAAISLLYSAEQRQARLAGNMVAATGANIAFNIALIPALGGLGAAIASAASYSVLLFLHVVGIRRARVFVGPATALVWLFSGVGIVLSASNAVVGVPLLPIAGAFLVVAVVPLRAVMRATLLLEPAR